MEIVLINDAVILKNCRNCSITLKELRRKELYRTNRLKTYALYGLNERDVYKVFIK